MKDIVIDGNSGQVIQHSESLSVPQKATQQKTAAENLAKFIFVSFQIALALRK